MEDDGSHFQIGLEMIGLHSNRQEADLQTGVRNSDELFVSKGFIIGIRPKVIRQKRAVSPFFLSISWSPSA